MKIKPCKHLDYEGEYTNCELKDCAPNFPEVKYWDRQQQQDKGALYEGAPLKVQFCKKRGRVNGIFQCYNIGEMHCHETEDV